MNVLQISHQKLKLLYTSIADVTDLHRKTDNKCWALMIFIVMKWQSSHSLRTTNSINFENPSVWRKQSPVCQKGLGTFLLLIHFRKDTFLLFRVAIAGVAGSCLLCRSLCYSFLVWKLPISWTRVCSARCHLVFGVTHNWRKVLPVSVCWWHAPSYWFLIESGAKQCPSHVWTLLFHKVSPFQCFIPPSRVVVALVLSRSYSDACTESQHQTCAVNPAYTKTWV